MHTQKFRALALTAVLAAGCSTAPETNAALDQARSTYAAASTSRLVAENAPLELRQAEESLRRAEAALTSGADPAEVNHRAYIASRRVEIAQETAELKQARDLVANADTARAQTLLQTRTQEADAARSRAADLERQLSELQAERTERGLVMTLGDVLFAVDQADLTPGAQERIDRLAGFLKRNPDRTVRIEGYTDSTGGEDYNLRLSEQRAVAVREALLTRGVQPDRVVSQGFGEARPVATNATGPGRQANRRVEIVISDDAGTIATSDD